MESSLQSQLKSWRQHLHQNPETGFEEVATSDYIARPLKALGLDVHRGIGGTGLVANLTVGNGRGAKAMMKDGLFERYPVDAIFGAHNMPGMPRRYIRDARRWHHGQRRQFRHSH